MRTVERRTSVFHIKWPFLYKIVVVVYRAGANHGPMADPPLGLPSPSHKHPKTTTSISVEDFQPRVTIAPARTTRKSAQHSENYAPEEGTGRVTTCEVRQLIDTLKDIITHQTTLTQSTKTELQEVKHDQKALQTQNERLHEEVQVLRTKIDGLLSTPQQDRATVAANPGPSGEQPTTREGPELRENQHPTLPA